MAERNWNDNYADGFLPWDTGKPEPALVAAVESGVISRGRALEVGCGTGTNAIWLAQRGFEVVAIDVAPLAIAQAQKKAAEAGVDVDLSVHDFLAAPLEGEPFALVFDRGVWHVFDEAAERAKFARHVAQSLHAGGQWLSLAGSTEGPPRDHGPPRRSARDLVTAVEPVLEIVELRTMEFDANIPSVARAWTMRARVRDVPAVPSTRH